MLELLEKGELQKLQKNWWINKGDCVVEETKVLCIVYLRIAVSLMVHTYIGA